MDRFSSSRARGSKSTGKLPAPDPGVARSLRLERRSGAIEQLSAELAAMNVRLRSPAPQSSAVAAAADASGVRQSRVSSQHPSESSPRLRSAQAVEHASPSPLPAAPSVDAQVLGGVRYYHRVIHQVPHRSPSTSHPQAPSGSEAADATPTLASLMALFQQQQVMMQQQAAELAQLKALQASAPVIPLASPLVFDHADSPAGDDAGQQAALQEAIAQLRRQNPD